MKILILGASGLIGSNVFEYLSSATKHEVWGTYRRCSVLQEFPNQLLSHLIPFNYKSINDINALLEDNCVDVVVNALGLTKHVNILNHEMDFIRVNSLFPHELGYCCEQRGIKLIHISTDCVFSGKKGFYTEADIPDSNDIYGRSKAMGEITYGPHLTIRISTIGREKGTRNGLLEWFLSQDQSCKGYQDAIFSGLPSRYFAFILNHYILNNPLIAGLYHIAGLPINKYQLLNELAIHYGKEINIISDRSLAINRSLDSTQFSVLTSYQPPSLTGLINHEWL